MKTVVTALVAATILAGCSQSPDVDVPLVKLGHPACVGPELCTMHQKLSAWNTSVRHEWMSTSLKD